MKTSSEMEESEETEKKDETRSWRTRTIILMTTTRRSQDKTPTCSRGAGRMTFRLHKVR